MVTDTNFWSQDVTVIVYRQSFRSVGSPGPLRRKNLRNDGRCDDETPTATPRHELPETSSSFGSNQYFGENS